LLASQTTAYLPYKIQIMERSYLRRLNVSKVKIYIFATIAIIIAGFLFFKFSPFLSKTSTTSESKTTIRDAKATINLNREFKFPLKNDKGDVIGEIKYVIENVELRDQIIIKGRKASAVQGRVFLVLNLKVVNDSNKTISMNTKDYARLSVNGNENELLAPSIHNDPVVIDAISTKPTRIGFAISEDDKDLKIKIGEIQGEKTNIDIKF